MKITNRLGLPQPLVDAITIDRIDPVPLNSRRIRVTELIQPTQKVYLERKHAAELEEDVSDRIWALLGSTVHSILQKSPDLSLKERRYETEFHAWTISGAFDRLALLAKPGTGLRQILQDYKVTTAWQVLDGKPNPEWVLQANLYRWLLNRNGYDVQELQVVTILRDWSKLEAKRRPQDYPRHQVQIIDLPVMETPKLEAWITTRIIEHNAIQDRGWVYCSDEDRWARPATFAVKKEGRKSALRVLNSEHDALDWCRRNGFSERVPGANISLVELKPGISIEERPAQYVRCESYCSAAPFCDQWKADEKKLNQKGVE